MCIVIRRVKSSFNNKTFWCLYDNEYNEKLFIIFLDSIQLEFLGDKLLLRNRVHWSSCSEYLLIVEEIFDKTMYQNGDTISNKITGFRGDSVYLYSTGKGYICSTKSFAFLQECRLNKKLDQPVDSAIRFGITKSPISSKTKREGKPNIALP